MRIDIWDVVRYTANSFVLVMIMFSFLHIMYKPKYDKKWIYFVLYFATVTIKVLVSLLRIPEINVLCGLLLICALSFFLYDCGFRKSIIYNACYYIASAFSDIFSTSLFALFGKKTIEETLDSQLIMYLSSVLNWITLFFLYRLLVYFFNRNEKTVIQTKEIIFLGYVTVLEFIIIFHTVNQIEKRSTGFFLIFLVLAFFALNLYITRLLEQVARNAQLKRELALALQQSTYQLKYYQEITDKQELARKVTHDVRKHLEAIDKMYSQNDITVAKKYSGLLDQELDKLTYGFTCSNKILSAIIGTKLHQAEAMQIKMEVDAEDIWMDFINDLDITAIFANLLDNSFEACSAPEVKSKRIEFRLWKYNNFIVLNISNPVGKLPEKKGKVFFTSKEGHDGIGLSNVLSAVEKYNGTFKTVIEDNNFIVKITIPIPAEY